jgi:hypothetical protein
MRKVQVFKWEQQQGLLGITKNVRVPDYTGLLHQLGQDCDDHGASIPVAIVESADGKLNSIHVDMVQFAPGSRAESPVVSELRKADRIINVMLNIMTLAQQNAAGAKLEAEGVSPDGMTRAHERRAALTAAGAA